jgi:hypothetical protein
MTVLRSNSAGRTAEPLLPASVTIALKKRCWQLTGMALIGAAVIMGAAVLSYAPGDPSFNSATDNAPINLAGHWGAVFSDLVLQIVGYAALIVPLAFTVWSAMILSHGTLARPGGRFGWLTMAVILSAVGFAGFATPNGWPLVAGLGGVAGALAYNELVMWAGRLGIRPAPDVVLWTTLTLAMAATIISLGMGPRDWVNAARGAWQGLKRGYALSLSVFGAARDLGERAHDFRDRLKEFAPLKPINGVPAAYQDPNDDDDDDEEEVHKGGVLDAAFGGTGKRETVVDPPPPHPPRPVASRRCRSAPGKISPRRRWSFLIWHKAPARKPAKAAKPCNRMPVICRRCWKSTASRARSLKSVRAPSSLCMNLSPHPVPRHHA